MRNAPFQFVPENWFGFFAAHGWQPEQIRYVSDEADRLGRPIPIPFLMKLWVKIALPFVSKARREADEAVCRLCSFDAELIARIYCCRAPTMAA